MVVNVMLSVNEHIRSIRRVFYSFMYNSLTTACLHLDIIKYDLALKRINHPYPPLSHSQGYMI